MFDAEVEVELDSCCDRGTMLLLLTAWNAEFDEKKPFIIPPLLDDGAGAGALDGGEATDIPLFVGEDNMEAVGVNPGRELTPLGPNSSALPLRLSPILLEKAVSKGIKPRLVLD